MINLVVMAALSTSPFISGSSLANTLSEPQLTAKQQNSVGDEDIGMGIGLVIGAIIAGPVGAIVTGVMSALVVKNSQVENQVGQLDVALAQVKNQAMHDRSGFARKLQQAEQSYQTELLAMQQNYQASEQLQAQNLLMSLQFDTGASELAPHYQEQVIALVALLKRASNMTIDLSGYTDLQGHKAVNQVLSLARVNSVKNALIAQGIERSRINTFAFGEERPIVANANQPVSFYDRRVEINLRNNASQTANNN